MTTTTASTTELADPHIDYSVALEEIAWPVAIVMVAALIFVALKGRFFPGGRVQFGDKMVEIGGDTGKTRNLSQADQALLLMAGLTDRKYQTANEVRAQQKRIIDDYYDRFMDVLHEVKEVRADLLWRHFADPLVNAAEENHILSLIDGKGNLDPYYVQEKMLMVQARYSRMLSLSRRIDGTCGENCLPDWQEVETPLQMVMVACLQDFAEISRKAWGSFRTSVEDSRPFFPRTGFLLDRLLEAF